MENASKALIIAGAILISILIIAIGMYIYTSSTNSITGAIATMDTQEIEAFNSQWTNYEGTLTGSQVKAMINKLIANANTYKEEEEKVVGLTYPENGTSNTQNVIINYASVNDSVSNYIGNLNTAYSAIKAKHNYTVSLDFGGTPLVRQIIVTY